MWTCIVIYYICWILCHSESELIFLHQVIKNEWKVVKEFLFVFDWIELITLDVKKCVCVCFVFYSLDKRNTQKKQQFSHYIIHITYLIYNIQVDEYEKCERKRPNSKILLASQNYLSLLHCTHNHLYESILSYSFHCFSSIRSLSFIHSIYIYTASHICVYKIQMTAI